MKYIVFSLAFWLLPFYASTQSKSGFSINVEINTNLSSSNIRDSWPSRQDVNVYSNYYNFGSNRISADFLFTQFGVRPEYSFAQDKLSLSVGLRYTQLDSEMAKSDADNGGFFYLRYGTSDTKTEYARVKAITEQTSYLGFPFEFRITPFRWLKLAPYFRVGTEIGFKLASSNSIVFENEAMKAREKQIFDEHGFIPNAIFSTVYSAVGVSLGAAREINYNIEFLLPFFFLSNNNSSLINNEEFSGIRFSVNFPLSKLF